MRPVALFAALLLAAPGGLSAQGSARQDTARRDGAPAWIGVGLAGRTSCGDGHGGPARTASDCRTAFIAETVVLGSPADSAGIEPGDTLLAIAGQALGTAAGERVLGGLRVGHPVDVRVGREGGERTVRVVPRARPSGTPVVRVRVAGVDADGPDVVRVRLAPPAVSPVLTLHGIPAVPAPGGTVTSSTYTLTLPARRAPDGSETLFRIDMNGRPMVWRTLDGAAPDSMSPDLRALRDSVLEEARARLDSLREVFRDHVWATMRNADAFGAPGSTARLAGAEFRPLSPALAEYFRGAARGLLVLRVLPGTPAGSLGLRPGDVVVRAAGEPVRDALDLRSALVRVAPTDSVAVVWVRKGRTMKGILKGR
jgi:membrane-associated protease RseP (regulator of RpoE activity)